MPPRLPPIPVFESTEPRAAAFIAYCRERKVHAYRGRARDLAVSQRVRGLAVNGRVPERVAELHGEWREGL